MRLLSACPLMIPTAVMLNASSEGAILGWSARVPWVLAYVLQNPGSRPTCWLIGRKNGLQVLTIP